MLVRAQAAAPQVGRLYAWIALTNIKVGDMAQLVAPQPRWSVPGVSAGSRMVCRQPVQQRRGGATAPGSIRGGDRGAIGVCAWLPWQRLELSLLAPNGGSSHAASRRLRRPLQALLRSMACSACLMTWPM